jgi:ATP-dependent DNA ligase
MPTSVVPMLATKIGSPFSREGWLFEPKWDGYRAICFLRDGQVRFTSRNQRDLTKRFPELQSIAKSIKASTAIIDGEIVHLMRTACSALNNSRITDANAQLSTSLLISSFLTDRLFVISH